uniref:PPIase cyclophilin-type domain-containing protein n=1 Tax=Cyclophora tenuis TaxID=216820 RepID=A0A6U1QBG3_CYCTE
MACTAIALGAALSKVEESKLRAREEALRKQVYLLQNATVRESRREAVERFGVGPHHVKFDISIPGNEEENLSFTVELAPLHKMPHAVHLFLEQVYHELWDNTWFYLNGPHVLQAGPQDWDDDEEGKALQRFKDTQLDTLAFPEYSHDYPHVPWTLGFTGRPGGPDWYINKVDNTAPHGPGGQYQHELSEQADPCFAKISDGHDVLMKVFKMEIYPGSHEYAYFLQEPVEIVKARIVEPAVGNVIKPDNQPRKKVPKRPRMIHKDSFTAEP